jgi:hypothetical protein
MLMKRRTAGRAHLSLRSPISVNAVQESVLLGRVELAEAIIWVQVEAGGETVDICVPLSNVAGIQWEAQEG